MKIFKKQFVLLALIVFVGNSVFAQKEDSTDLPIPPAEWTVPNHKDNLKLTLIIESIHVGKKVQKLSFSQTFEIGFESEYVQVKDDIYIKIFIARNQEYRKKFYSWKWNYYKKNGSKYNSLGSGYYSPMSYNQPMPNIGDQALGNGAHGQGIGEYGKPDYLMFYYYYRLE